MNVAAEGRCASAVGLKVPAAVRLGAWHRIGQRDAVLEPTDGPVPPRIHHRRRPQLPPTAHRPSHRRRHRDIGVTMGHRDPGISSDGCVSTGRPLSGCGNSGTVSARHADRPALRAGRARGMQFPRVVVAAGSWNSCGDRAVRPGRRPALRRPHDGSPNRQIIGDIPTLPAAEGEVVAGGQRVGVIRAEHPDAVGEQPVEFGDRASESPNPAGPRPPDRGPYWVA